MSHTVPSDPGYAPGSQSASLPVPPATNISTNSPGAAWTRWLLPGLALLAVLAMVGWRVADILLTPAKPPRSAPPVAVDVSPVTRTTVVDRAAYTATLEPLARFVVAPRIGGRLTTLHVNIGDEVKQGGLIADLDAAELDQVVKEREASEKVATAEQTSRLAAFNAAKRELERLMNIKGAGIVTDADKDIAADRVSLAEAALGVASAQLEEASAQLSAARVRRSYASIAADWADKDRTRLVGERFVDEGDTLSANDPIVSLIDITSVIAVIHVPGRDYPRVAGKSDLRATITTDAWPGQSFSGTVLRVAPQLDEASRQARVEVLIPNPDRKLRPGMFARVTVDLDERRDAPTVPTAALVRHNGEHGVFVVHGSGESRTVKFLHVAPEIFDGPRVSIFPEPDGPVVTLGHHQLQDGGAVKVVGGDGKPAGNSSGNGNVSDLPEGRR